MSDLRVGVGASVAADTAAAVAEAVQAARASLGGADPQLAVVSATVDHDAGLVFAAIRRALPEAAIHGATSSLGVLVGDRVAMGPGGGLGVLLFASEGGSRFAAASASLEGGARAAGRRLAQIVAARRPTSAPPRVLLVAGTPGQEEEILAGIGDALPGVPILGGSAADHAIEGAWSVFGDDGARREGVSLAAIWGDARIGVAFGGPYEPSKKRAVVTEAQGRTIRRLDGRPAMAVLHEWVGHGVTDQARAGGNLLIQTSLSPLGVAHELADGGSYHRLLHPALAHPDGSVDLFNAAATGATVCLMRGSADSLVAIIDELATRALADAALASGEVRGALLIYCAGCAGAIGARLDEVLGRLKERLGGAPTLGFCTFGEQGFVPGIGNVHSNLSVGLVVTG